VRQDLAFLLSLRIKVMGTVLLLSEAFGVLEMKEVKVYFERCLIK